MLKVIGASWFQTRVSTCIVGAVSALGILAVILGELDTEVDDGIYSATVFWSKNAGFHIDFWGQGNEIKDIPYGVGRAYYRQDIGSTGWAVLEVQTRDGYPDWVQAYSAGLLEGSLTWQLIYWHWQNTVQNVCGDRAEFCKNVRNLVENNYERIKELARENGGSDPFWHQIHLFYVQLDGLETGWRHGVKRSRQEIDISHIDFLWMNAVSDLADMEQTFNRSLEDMQYPFIFSAAASFASAFVKFHTKTGELYAAHNSGGLYQSMLRLLKRYQLGYHRTSDPNSYLVPGKIITFSSYPGVIHSQDDFYMVVGGKKHQFAILGTAFNNCNGTYLSGLDQEKQVLIGPRVMAANRLAQDGHSWGRSLAQANSGTGSKQWLVVDYAQIADSEAVSAPRVGKKVMSKLLSSLQPKHQVLEETTKVPTEVRRNLLWVVEQIPGLTQCADQTHALQETGFWVSNGLPYYQDTSHICGRKWTRDKSGTQFFQNGEVNAANLTSVMQLMRNNTFLSTSHLFPQNTTSPRLPLNVPAMGTIDSKIFMASPIQKVELHVISGPPITYIENEANNSSIDIKILDVPFQWSKSRFANETHIGLPDLWHFNAVQPEWFWV